MVGVFGAAHPHHAYLFANRRANRMKVLVHDGIGVWLAARRLYAGKFVRLAEGANSLSLSRTQFDLDGRVTGPVPRIISVGPCPHRTLQERL